MLIRITIQTTRPLVGAAATTGGDPVPFEGWLELLRVLCDLVADDERARGIEAGGLGGD